MEMTMDEKMILLDEIIAEQNRQMNGVIPKETEEHRQMNAKYIKAIKESNGKITYEELCKIK